MLNRWLFLQIHKKAIRVIPWTLYVQYHVTVSNPFRYVSIVSMLLAIWYDLLQHYRERCTHWHIQDTDDRPVVKTGSYTALSCLTSTNTLNTPCMGSTIEPHTHPGSPCHYQKSRTCRGIPFMHVTQLIDLSH